MMNYFARIMACITTGIAVGLCMLGLLDSWLSDENGPLHLSRWIIFESRRSEALQQRIESVAHMMEIKLDITNELLAGRLSLREAIPQFQQANQLVGNRDLDMVAGYLTPTDRESVARQILAWVENSVEVWPPSRDR